MVDLNDKKNLPFVIGGFVLVLGVAGFFIFKQVQGPGGDTASTTTTAQPAPTPQSTSPLAKKLKAKKAGNGAATTTTTAVPVTTTPATGATTPPAVGAQGAIGNSGADPKLAETKPVPTNEFRSDPFAPLGGNKSVKRETPVIPRLAINPPILWHPKPKPIDEMYPVIKPLPKRRVAAILLGNRISALIQTEGRGFETVRPGSTLTDGSVVQRIERDRVVIKTSEANPRIVEVKLAAAEIDLPQTTDPTQASGGVRRRSGGFGGSDGRPM